MEINRSTSNRLSVQVRAYGPLDTVITDLPWHPATSRHQSKPTMSSVIKRFRHTPRVKPSVRRLAATAALLSALAQSRTMGARKASDHEFRGCCSSFRKAIFCSGLTTSSRCLERPPGSILNRDNPLPTFMQSIYDSEDWCWQKIGRVAIEGPREHARRGPLNQGLGGFPPTLVRV